MPVTRLGVCSWSLQPASPEELITQVRETGLERVQLALSPLVSQRDQWGRTLELLADAGLEVVSGMMAPVGEDYTSLDSIARTGGLRPDATWPANEAMARAMAVVAGNAGIPLVSLHAGFLPHDRNDPERRRMIERLRTLVRIFADQGVQLALETGQESAATLLDVLEDVGGESLGVNFDPANMILYDRGDPVAAITALSPHVKQVHLKDAVAATASGQWGTEVPLGSGQVDWAGFFTVLRELPRNLDAIVEREAGSARIEDVRTAVARVHSLHGDGDLT